MFKFLAFEAILFTFFRMKLSLKLLLKLIKLKSGRKSNNFTTLYKRQKFCKRLRHGELFSALHKK